MAAPTRTTRTSRAAAVAALLALLLTGCGGAGGSTAGPVAEEAAPRAVPGSGDDGGTVKEDREGAGTASTVTVPERRIVRSEVGVEVDDLSRAAQQVRDLAIANGGEVSEESIGLSRTTSTGTPGGSFGASGPVGGVDVQPAVTALPGEARLVLRVPPDAVVATVGEIAALGTETGRWTSSTSVETTLVDLESRIATQTAAVEQAQVLMDRAQSLSDIVLLENEVNSRTAELESLKARQASVAGQAERATVTAVLQTRERTEQVADSSGFLGGLRAGWDALLASVGVLLMIVGAVLPFAVVGLLVGFPVHRLLRHRRERGRAGPGPTGPAPAPAPAPAYATAHALDRPVPPPAPPAPPAASTQRPD